MTRDRRPSNRDNWTLVCHECRLEFHVEQTIAVAAEHWAIEHRERAAGWTLETTDVGVQPHFELLWVGLGPAPESPPAGILP